VRRRILDLLLERPRSVSELVDELRLSQGGTSKQLRVLRDAGLVQVRPDAQRRFYELRPDPLIELDAWLERFRQRRSGPGRDRSAVQERAPPITAALSG
jgi:DNA-binding transcriptional ArsR family regulator